MKLTVRPCNPVQSPFGKKLPDSTGSAIGAARMDPAKTFKLISSLLQDYINSGRESSWEEIREITDRVYDTVACAMDALEAEAPFTVEIARQMASGKKLFFKVNLVILPHIDYRTHGLGIPGACTEWSFTAAVMRWFHDKAGISYHHMSAGEAATNTSQESEKMSAATGRRVTREAIMEGKYPGGYGGWGFYYARKYLAERHDPGHKDDPLSGYQESLDGHCLPPGTVTDKLLIYDINVVNDRNGREVPVPGGVNFKTIIMHKAIIGGDPADAQDIQDWPGCILVNLPKMKVHISELFTCAVKNLGMGLFSMEVNASRKPGEYNWKYSAPNLPHPTFKLNVPHSRYLLETDLDTLMPVRDKNGDYIWKKTGGMQATMADAIQAVQDQGITMLHVADLIEMVNVNNSSVEGVTVPEGLVLAGIDPVALDVCAARYMFTMVPMAEAAKIRTEYHLKSDVIQYTPLPRLEGNNIVTGEGYDSSFSRYHAMQYCEERGLGQQRFYVTGEDLWQGGRLASLEQHLGRVENGIFLELLTTTMYYAPRKPVYDLQNMSFAYLELNDKLTGADYKKQLMDIYDENHDGVIDYMEKGRGTSPVLLALQTSLVHQKHIDPTVLAKVRFLVAMTQAKLSCEEWNTEGHSLGAGFMLAQAVSTAFEMSRAKVENPDPLYPGRQWGNGKWPSLQFILREAQYARIYGHAFPVRIDVYMSPYGQAFYYADVKYNGAKYCTAVAMERREDIIAGYLKDVSAGTPPLPFTIYVPEGLGSYDGRTIPNIEETADPALIFTAAFNGREVWRELRLSEYNLT